MTILELFKKVNPSVLAAIIIFKHLKNNNQALKISDIADTSSGGTPNRGMIEYYNGDIPWIKSGELKDSIITQCNEYITTDGLKNSSAKLFPKGTLLVAMYGANIGKTGILDFDATTNQAVCAIFPKVDISKDFLFWYFKQQRMEFIAIGKGGAQPNISQTIINNAPIVVPEPKVQKKIVAFLQAIEQGKGVDINFFIPEILENIERLYKYKNSYIELSNSFESQLKQIENLNKAILHEAVKGKLVKQKHEDEPASELLKRIKENRKKSDKKVNPLSKIKSDEIPFEIPKNWEWCRLGDCVNLKRGKSKHRPRNDVKLFSNGVYPFIQTGDVSKAKNNNDLITTIHGYYNDLGLSQSEMQSKGTLCITIAANIAECGFLSFDACVPDSVVCLQAFDKSIEIYVYHYLKLAKADLERFAPATAQKNINLGILNDLLIPLPPLNEQKRIISEIEKQLTKAKHLKAHVITNQQATEQLIKALLQQTFEGKTDTKKTIKKLQATEHAPSRIDFNALVTNPFEQYLPIGTNNIKDINWELALMVAYIEQKLGIGYGDVGLQKNVFNLSVKLPMFSKPYNFINSNFGTYSYELKDDLNNNPYLTKRTVKGKEIYAINDKFKKQILDKLSDLENKDFVQRFDKLLGIYEHQFINKETDKIELFNTVLKVAIDQKSQEIDVIYQGMMEWKIKQDRFKTKAEKFSKTDVQKMLKLLIAKNMLEI